MTDNHMPDPIERELTELPTRAMDLGAIERIEDALAAEAVLGPAVIEPKSGLLEKRVPLWTTLAASLVLSCGAGALAWTLKPIQTVERVRVVTEPAPPTETEPPPSEPIVEVVRLDRPLFARPDRTGIDPSRWTTGH